MQMNNNKRQDTVLSIIVPVYNVEKYLKTYINSLLEQKLDAYEIILVDDGSTDSSGGICDEYAKKHEKIQVIHKKNGGLSSARNTGIENAVGNILALLTVMIILCRKCIKILLRWPKCVMHRWL